MRYAFDHGCDLAMMVAEAGSNSQRNAERKGFRIAYTRTKWRLFRKQRGDDARLYRGKPSDWNLGLVEGGAEGIKLGNWGCPGRR